MERDFKHLHLIEPFSTGFVISSEVDREAMRRATDPKYSLLTPMDIAVMAGDHIVAALSGGVQADIDGLSHHLMRLILMYITKTKTYERTLAEWARTEDRSERDMHLMVSLYPGEGDKGYLFRPHACFLPSAMPMTTAGLLEKVKMVVEFDREHYPHLMPRGFVPEYLPLRLLKDAVSKEETTEN